MTKKLLTFLLTALLLPSILTAASLYFDIAPVLANDIESQPEWMTAQLNGMLREVLPGFRTYSYKDSVTGLEISYSLYVPKDYDPEKEYPMVVFIGDARTVGDDPMLSLAQGFGGIIWATEKEQEKHPSFVLVPQFPVTILNESGMTDYVLIVPRLIEEVSDAWPIDTSRVYCTGQSMGCMSLLYLAANNPGLFAAGLFVDGQWNIEELEGLMGQSFIYITAAGDDRASQGQSEVKAMFRENNVPFLEVNGLSAKSGNLNAVFKLLLGEGNKHNFVTWKKGTVLPDVIPEGKRVMEHVASFNYGYTTATIRDWLFEQDTDK